MDKILSGLNEPQIEVVKHIDGPLLVIAGAGSGKTKTITSRLAYLLSLGVDPASTLTLTFTNKAASEMRSRAMEMIDSPLYPPLLCTFHKFGLLFLKFHIHELGRKANFIIIDSDDRKRILKNINKELPPNLVSSEISRFKNSLLSDEEAHVQADSKNDKLIASIYQKYNAYLESNNIVDFDDLIALPFKILDSDDALCEEVSKKYSFVMVDEYQDTNTLQYWLIKKLCKTHENICAVGDDDQSIYGWRGANINNILDFQKNFTDVKLVRLESNYRSTEPILDAANRLINFNKNRLGKTLKSFLGDGRDVRIFRSEDEEDEAYKIAKEIKQMSQNGVNPSEIAVLFRVNALSRGLEDKLNRLKIPYKIVGSVKFYERAEIKDVISYFRLVVNPDDDFSFKRVINRPKRGIGKVTIEKLEGFAASKSTSINAAFHDYPSEVSSLMGAKQFKAIGEFFETLNELKDILEDSSMRFIELFDEVLALKEQYRYSRDEIDRASNIDEIYALYKDFMIKNSGSSMDDFLNDISLQSDQDMLEGDKISCMSIHASKGLEFKHVFVIGLEEGIFPLVREGIDIEEERRLAYVAITRAKEDLILSYVDSRLHNGKRNSFLPSRFLKECGKIEGKFVYQEDRGGSGGFKKGDLVNHKIFGTGRILAVQKAGKDSKLTINFGGSEKNILASFVTKL
jgi:DNA helicase-2/ATP-dependent DNA helicase PcrA